MIEKVFDGTKFLGEVTKIDPQARMYTVYYKEDNTTEEMTHYYIKKFLHKDEMKKYPIGTKIKKKFMSLWYYGEIQSVNVENRFFRVKYDDNDEEDMSPVDVKKYLDTTEDNKRKRQTK